VLRPKWHKDKDAVAAYSAFAETGSEICMDSTRAIEIRSGIRIEFITIIWMVIEMAVAIGAGSPRAVFC